MPALAFGGLGHGTGDWMATIIRGVTAHWKNKGAQADIRGQSHDPENLLPEIRCGSKGEIKLTWIST